MNLMGCRKYLRLLWIPLSIALSLGPLSSCTKSKGNKPAENELAKELAGYWMLDDSQYLQDKELTTLTGFYLTVRLDTEGKVFNIISPTSEKYVGNLLPDGRLPFSQEFLNDLNGFESDAQSRVSSLVLQVTRVNHDKVNLSFNSVTLVNGQNPLKANRSGGNSDEGSLPFIRISKEEALSRKATGVNPGKTVVDNGTLVTIDNLSAAVGMWQKTPNSAKSSAADFENSSVDSGLRVLQITADGHVLLQDSLGSGSPPPPQQWISVATIEENWKFKADSDYLEEVNRQRDPSLPPTKEFSFALFLLSADKSTQLVLVPIFSSNSTRESVEQSFTEAIENGFALKYTRVKETN